MKTNRPQGIFKTSNEYAERFSPELYERTPKAVWAALVASYLDQLGMNDDLNAEVLAEWKILHNNEIIPQVPPKGKE